MIAAAVSMTALAADDRTLGEKTSDTLKKAGEKTKEAGRAVVEGTKEAGRAVADESKKAAEVVKDAVTPDADARRVDVALTDKKIELPMHIAAGKTAFVVRNNGSMRQNFQISGEGLEKRFLMDVAPNDSKTLNVDLKPGSYKVSIPDSKDARMTETTLTVK